MEAPGSRVPIPFQRMRTNSGNKRVVSFNPQLAPVAQGDEATNSDGVKARIDTILPELSALALASDNLGTPDSDRPTHLLATTGNTVTLSFTTSERISGFAEGDNSVYAPQVFLTGSEGLSLATTVTRMGDNGISWQAVYEVSAEDAGVESDLDFSIVVTDPVGNPRTYNGVEEFPCS